MKKLNLLFLLLTIPIALLFSQKYVYSSGSVSGSEYYVYTNIIKTNNTGIYQICVKVVYTGKSRNETIEFLKEYKNEEITDDQIEDLFYSEFIYLMDIKRNRYKILGSTYKTFSENIIKSYSYDEHKTDWDYIYPESVFDSVLKTVKSLLKKKK